MNIDHTRIDAAARARLSGRSSFVRAVALACALAGSGAAIGGTLPDKDPPRVALQERVAAAHERAATVRAERADRVQQASAPVQPAAPVMASPRQAERQIEQRQPDPRFDGRADDARRAQQAQQEQATRNAEAFRRSGRLTPDERRDLRRQINEAGLDIYPNTPRR